MVLAPLQDGHVLAVEPTPQLRDERFRVVHEPSSNLLK